jgi:hypothetical protein
MQMENGTKKTSKREFAFVIDATAATVSIIDKDKNVLRTFKVANLPGEIAAILVVHGLKQKLTDDTMVSKIGDDGDRLLACDELWERLKAGEWEKEREGLARVPEALVQFVVEVKGVSREVATASLKAAGKEKWDAIRASNLKDIEAIEKRLKEAKAAAEATSLDDLT